MSNLNAIRENLRQTREINNLQNYLFGNVINSRPQLNLFLNRTRENRNAPFFRDIDNPEEWANVNDRYDQQLNNLRNMIHEKERLQEVLRERKSRQPRIRQRTLDSISVPRNQYRQHLPDSTISLISDYLQPNYRNTARRVITEMRTNNGRGRKSRRRRKSNRRHRHRHRRR